MSEEVLTKEEISHLKSLIKSEEAEKIAEASERLRKSEATEADYLKLFSKTVVYRLLCTWEPKIWDDLCGILCTHTKTQKMLKEQIEKRVNCNSKNIKLHKELWNNLGNLCFHCDPCVFELLGELCHISFWGYPIKMTTEHIQLSKTLSRYRKKNNS